MAVELTPRAQRMMESLPDYYAGNDLVERAMLSAANELDRIDARLDALIRSLIPTTATDDLGGLARWERLTGLPPNPAGATVAQRVDKVCAALQAIGSFSAADVIEALRQAAGVATVDTHRDTPAYGQDTLEIPYEAGSYNAAQVQAIAVRRWPAHRPLFMRYSTGFLADLSRLDADTL